MISEQFKSLLTLLKEIDKMDVPNPSELSEKKRVIFYPMVGMLRVFLDSLSIAVAKLEVSLLGINDAVDVIYSGMMARIERIKFIIYSSINASNGGLSSGEEIITPDIIKTSGVIFLSEGRGYILK